MRKLCSDCEALNEIQYNDKKWKSELRFHKVTNISGTDYYDFTMKYGPIQMGGGKKGYRNSESLTVKNFVYET